MPENDARIDHGPVEPFLFQAALGDVWKDLPTSLLRLHEVSDVHRAAGGARVDRGRGLTARLVALLFRFPKSGTDIPVTVTMTRRRGKQSPGGEIWIRDFGGRRFRSHLSPAGPGRVQERFGAFSFEIALLHSDSGLQFDVKRGWCLGIPMPRFLLPGVDTREHEEGGRFHFDVRLASPFTRALIVRYRGWLEPKGEGEAIRPPPRRYR